MTTWTPGWPRWQRSSRLTAAGGFSGRRLPRAVACRRRRRPLWSCRCFQQLDRCPHTAAAALACRACRMSRQVSCTWQSESLWPGVGKWCNTLPHTAAAEPGSLLASHPTSNPDSVATLHPQVQRAEAERAAMQEELLAAARREAAATQAAKAAPRLQQRLQVSLTHRRLL